MGNKDNEKQRVANYVRVSSQEQAVEGVSIDAQTVSLFVSYRIALIYALFTPLLFSFHTQVYLLPNATRI